MRNSPRFQWKKEAILPLGGDGDGSRRLGAGRAMYAVEEEEAMSK
jgi:hypothetical protein